jgi:protein TonB
VKQVAVSMPELVNRNEIQDLLYTLYPSAQRRAGREGEVTLELEVGADGRVGRVEVVKSGGAAFDSAARAVARRMRFKPAAGASGPASVVVRQSVAFRLGD